MKYLLTSSGISNDSIRNALVDLPGKQSAESSALCIPTAAYACPDGAAMAWRFLRGVARSPLCARGVEVVGSVGAHRSAQYRARTVGPSGPGG